MDLEQESYSLVYSQDTLFPVQESTEQKKPRKLYVVDGSGYIFRAFYAVTPLSNAAGLPTNALFGYTRMMLKLLVDTDAEYVVVAFDTQTPTFRHKLYEKYKANRKECPEDLKPQFPYFRSITKALGVKVLEEPGFEADDVIASICKNQLDHFEEVIVVSADKDLTQLVSPKIKMWDAMRDVIFTEGKVKEKFGVTPAQIVDLLALRGDSSDNVPGAKGIGEKGAEKIINFFGSLENLYQNLDKILEIPDLRAKEKIKQSLIENQELILLSQQLVKLVSDVEPYTSIDDQDFFKVETPDLSATKELFKELEFLKLIDSLSKLKHLDGLKSSATSTNNLVGKNFILLNSDNIQNFLQSLIVQKEVAFDTETDSLDTVTPQLVGMSFSWESGTGYYLPVVGDGAIKLEDIYEPLNKFFSSPEVLKIGSNIKFDIAIMAGVKVKVVGPYFDTMLASSLLHPDKRQNGLKFLVKTWLNEEMVEYEDLIKGYTKTSEVPLDILKNYAAHDAEASWNLRLKLEEALKKEGKLFEVLKNLETPLIDVLVSMEREGVLIDKTYLENLGKELDQDLQKLEKEILGELGVTINLNSPKQLSEVLFNQVGASTLGIKKRQSGFSTDAKALKKLAKDFPVVQKILEYREFYKLKTTYVEGLLKIIHPATGRIHTSYNQAIAATGRLSSMSPNLQNIPIRTHHGRKIRKAFVAGEGNILLSVDYSQIELRLLAHFSNDRRLVDAFNKDEDIHLTTAKLIFPQINLFEDEALIKEQRRIAKTINFGIIYGMGAFRLAEELKIPRKQAQEFIDNYFAEYPNVKEYFALQTELIRSQGYVETLLGRRRYLDEIDSSGRDPGYAERSLLNAPIQGSAAEIIKLAMISLDKRLRTDATTKVSDVRMILQVHDELVFEVKEDNRVALEVLVTEEMQSTSKIKELNLRVPLKVDISYAKHWD